MASGDALCKKGNADRIFQSEYHKTAEWTLNNLKIVIVQKRRILKEPTGIRHLKKALTERRKIIKKNMTR